MNAATILEARQLAIIDQPRSESAKAWHLPDEHFIMAVEAELAGVPLRRIQEMLAAEGLPPEKIPSRSRWSEFWSQFKPFLRLARRRSAASGANEVAAEAQNSPAQFDAATVDLIKQLAFELADSDAPDVRGVKSLVGLLLKHSDHQLQLKKLEQQKASDDTRFKNQEAALALAARRLELLEKKEKETCQTLADGALSAEEKEQRIKAVFGIRG